MPTGTTSSTVPAIGTIGTVDIVARDRRSPTVALLSSFGSPSNSAIELQGVVNVSQEPGDSLPLAIPFLASFGVADDQRIVLKEVENGFQLFTSDGEPVASPISSYHRTAVHLNGGYEIHSGVIREGENEVDVFAISDPVEVAIAGLVVGACLVVYAGQLLIVKQIMDDYRAKGLVPEVKIKSGLLKALTCQFDVVITARDPKGEVVESKRRRIGRGR